MKVLIADLPKAQNRNINYEIGLLKAEFPDVETVYTTTMMQKRMSLKHF